MNSIFLNIDTKKFSNSDIDIDSLLYDYFNNFDIDYNLNNDILELELTPHDYTVFDNINFIKSHFGYRISNILKNNFYFVTPNHCLCLSESWLPLAWSLYQKKNGVPKNLTILHFDFHSDLMSPYLYYHNNNYYNMLTREIFDFNSIKSVKKAITTGSIYIGSMLTTFLLDPQKINIIHFKQNTTPSFFNLKISTYEDTLIDNSFKRIFVKKVRENSNIKYYLTDNYINVFKYIIHDSIILLHIDMDFFNNRYNCNSSWRCDKNHFDPSIDMQFQKIKEVCNFLGNVNDKFRINLCYVGMSPSFYPIEFWKSGLVFLLNELNNKSINVQPLNILVQKIFRYEE